MCDPVKRPLTWSKKFYAYNEHHGVYDVMKALMKELAISRPEDPLTYIKDEIQRIGGSIYSPKVFMLGDEPLVPLLAEGISNHCGAKFFTLKTIIQNTSADIRPHLLHFLRNGDVQNEYQRKLLISTIARRLVAADCIKCGYVLYGFPQSRLQALMAQACGLIPKQVFVLLPQGPPEEVNRKNSGLDNSCSSGSANSTEFTDIFSKNKLQVQYTANQLKLYQEYFEMKDTATAYTAEILKVQTYEQWNAMEPLDLEAEFLSVVVTKPNSGAPWIPRILIIGPPASGKRTLAQKIASKYRVLAFGWIDVIRGALALDDAYADECKMYLHDFTPLTDDCVSTLLKRRLYRDDCMKKGFVLFGFPETSNQADVLDVVALTPNRVFLLSCPETMSMERIAKKKKEILARQVPRNAVLYQSVSMLEMDDEGDTVETKESYGQNPYSDEAIRAKFEYYNNNLPGVLHHFGSSVMYVDATEELEVVMDYVMACTLRPPNIRFD